MAETDDLIEFMKTPIHDVNDPEEKSGVEPDPLDFGPAPWQPEPEIKPEPEPEPVQVVEPEPLEPEATEEELKGIAESYIGMLDLLNQIILPRVYANSIFEKQELPIVVKLKEKIIKEGKEGLTDGEKMLLERMETLTQLKESIDFEEHEIKQLTGPFVRVLKKYKSLQTSPVMELAMALAIVQGMRMIPLSQGLYNKLMV